MAYGLNVVVNSPKSGHFRRHFHGTPHSSCKSGFCRRFDRWTRWIGKNRPQESKFRSEKATCITLQRRETTSYKPPESHTDWRITHNCALSWGLYQTWIYRFISHGNESETNYNSGAFASMARVHNSSQAVQPNIWIIDGLS